MDTEDMFTADRGHVHTRAQPRFNSGGPNRGANRPRFEGEARIEGDARERAGERSGEVAR